MGYLTTTPSSQESKGEIFLTKQFCIKITCLPTEITFTTNTLPITKIDTLTNYQTKTVSGELL